MRRLLERRAPCAAASISIAVLLTLGCQALDGKAPAPVERSGSPRVERILAAATRDPRAYEFLTELVRVAPKRLSGSADADHAVKWGEERMQSLGFDRVRLEPVKVPVWTRGPVEEVRVSIGNFFDMEGEALRISAIGGSPSTPKEGIEAGVVEVKSFEELRALGKKAVGQIVFFNRPMDASDPETFRAYGGAVNQRGQGGAEARKAGAIGALVRSATTKLDDSPHTGGGSAFLEDGKTPIVPVAAVSTLGADRLHQLLQTHGDAVRVKLRLSSRFEPDRMSANVVGEIVGSEFPDEIVLVGGHLDAWDTGVGAHDDGAGCVHSIEALRLLRAVGAKPKRTIRAVLFMNEENGLAGGKAYAKTHKDENHVFAIESDAGGFRPWMFMSTSKEPVFTTMQRVGAELTGIGIREVRQGGGGADISPLENLGVPCAQLVTDPKSYFDYHHAETDQLEVVNGWDLELGAVALAVVLWEIADR